VARFFLDTTVLIDVLRGRSAAERLLELGETSEVPFVCAVNVEEVFRGLRKGEEGAVRRLLDGLRVAPVGRREGETAGSWRRAFADRGITLSQADCLVAAAAVGIGARLITGNPKDFPMPGLIVEHWPAGN
jgi:predicted nucleic acid-binding protein